MFFNNNKEKCLIYYNTLTKGKGVMTIKRIKKGSFIMWYEGDYVDKRYRNLVGSDEAIIALYNMENKYNYDTEQGYICVSEPYHFSHFINDCLSDNNFEKSKNGFNVLPVLKKRKSKGNIFWPCYIALKDIEIGEPLETFYGSSYWLYHYPNLYDDKLLAQIEKYSLIKNVENNLF